MQNKNVLCNCYSFKMVFSCCSREWKNSLRVNRTLDKVPKNFEMATTIGLLDDGCKNAQTAVIISSLEIATLSLPLHIDRNLVQNDHVVVVVIIVLVRGRPKPV